MIKKLKQKFLERNGEGDMELPNSLAQSNDEAIVKAMRNRQTAQEIKEMTLRDTKL